MKKEYYIYAILFSLVLGLINRPKESSMPLIEIAGITIVMLPFVLLGFFLFHKLVNKKNNK
tara:strand:- start:86 stop:268 length:183 start_codon:yes stop_codon:yes gene_type:complete